MVAAADNPRAGDGLGDTAQRLRARAALAENRGFIPTTRMLSREPL